jgi:hypothetical protein
MDYVSYLMNVATPESKAVTDPIKRQFYYIYTQCLLWIVIEYDARQIP